MAISDMFRNSFETSSVSSNPKLRTRYYGNDLQTTQMRVTNVLKNAGFQLIHVDNYYHELLFEGKRKQVIVTLSEMGLYETGVLLKVNTHYFLPFGRGISLIQAIYNAIDKVLILKSKGYHDEQ